MVTAGILSPASADSGIDLHWLWDDRCTSCHGHSSDFAHKFLTASGNRLQGKHHVDDLPVFLRNHYLTDQLADEVYAMLLAQLIYPPRFKNECSSCHGSAAGFVREKLLLQNEELTIRNTATNVNEFLKKHRRLNDKDVGFYLMLLTRVAKEVKAIQY